MSSGPTKKWEKLLQAQLLENQSKYFAQLTANEKSQQVAPFTKFAFPVIRKASPQLVASNIVSVQPMTGPIGAGLYKKWKSLVGDDEDEPPFKLDIPVRSLFTRKLKSGIERKIVGLITKLGENKDAEPFAVVEDAETGESFTFYFHEMEKVSLLEVVAAAAKEPGEHPPLPGEPPKQSAPGG